MNKNLDCIAFHEAGHAVGHILGRTVLVIHEKPPGLISEGRQ
jgi:hypothetical protein